MAEPDDTDGAASDDAVSLFARPLLPVANPDDAATTAAAALPRIAAVGGRPLVVNVVEKGGGAPDKAPLEQMELLADESFEVVREWAAEYDVEIDTETLYGTDVPETIFEAAREADVTAIVFTPREGNRLWDLFTGGVRHDLVTESDRPVVVLPSREET
jgi:nucleotide-binding universal stress UspA family protein